jgi:hypothetical protein
MNDSIPLNTPPEPGRILRPHEDQLRWVRGLRTLHRYEADWLRHDIAAGLVLR